VRSVSRFENHNVVGVIDLNRTKLTQHVLSDKNVETKFAWALRNDHGDSEPFAADCQVGQGRATENASSQRGAFRAAKENDG
jgi:hypothetical protein